MIYFIGSKEKIIDNDGSIQYLDIDTAIKMILKNNIICEDIETKSLDFTLPNQVKLIQLGTNDNQYIFDVGSCNYIKLKEILENKKIVKINANGIFERTMLTSIGIRINSMFDLLLAARIIRQGKKDRMVETINGKSYIYSLAGIYKELLGIDIEKETRKSFLENKDTYTLKEIKYAAKDVKIFDLYDEIIRRLLKYNLVKEKMELWKDLEQSLKDNEFSVTYLEMKALEYFADMSYNGIKLSKDKLIKLYEYNIQERWNIEKELNKLVIDKYPKYKSYYINPLAVNNTVQLNLFGEEENSKKEVKNYNRRINWNSHIQVKDIIFSELEKTIVDKYGKLSISIKLLDKPIYKKNQIVNKYIKSKKLSKLIDTYGIKYLSNINKNTNRIHTSINQIVDTGRISSRNPNIQQIPKDKLWREMFESEKGFKMVGADYSAQESQVMADKSEDTAFIDFFLNGDGDSHSMVASRVFSAKEKREIKVTKYKLFIDLQLDSENDIKERYKEFYPKADKIYRSEKYIVFEDTTESEECPLRFKGKILNFFISFGGSEYTLAKDQDITLKEAKELIDSFWEGFMGLHKYFKEEREKAINRGYIIINEITNRRRWLVDYKEFRILVNKKVEIHKSLIEINGKQKGDKMFYDEIKTKNSELSNMNIRSHKLRGDMERLGMNSGIQGTAADMTKTALVLMKEKIENRGLSMIEDIKPVNTIHDEPLLESKIEYSEFAASILKESMERASRIYNKILIIKASPYIADVWQH